MPIYKVQSPDGSILKIEGPEGATDEQLIQAATAAMPRKPAKAEKAVDPTQGMSGFEKFSAGAGKAVYDLGRGAGQMLGLVSQKDIDYAKSLDAPLMDTSAGTWGNVAGNVIAAAPTAFIPGVNTVVGGAAIGAGMGALQPTTAEDSRLQNMALGGVAGAVVPAATNLLKAGRAALYDPLAGQQKVLAGALRRAAGDDASNIVNQLKGKGAATSGVKLSAGTVSQNEGLAALEDAISSQLPSGNLARVAQTNRTALADALRNIAGTPEDLATLAASREGAANSLYGKAFQSDAMRRSLAKDAEEAVAGLGSAGGNFPKVDLATDGLRELANRPMFGKAMEQAKTLAANKGKNIGNPLESLEGLHYIKLALDDMANPMAETAIGKNQLAAVNSTRNALTEELAKVSPLYGNARQSFTEMSQPINQLEIGKALAEKLIPATSGDMPASLNYATLARAMRDPDAVARTATGFDGAQMARILSPDQMTTVQGVTSDASRLAEALKRGMGSGSPTTRRLAQGDILSQHFAEQAPITSRILEIVGKVPGANLATKGVSAIGSMATDRINSNLLSQLDQMLANDPQQVARLIQNELSRVNPTEAQRVLRALPQSLMLAMPSVEAAQ